MENYNSSPNDDILSYMSVIGSSISAICFFAPWIGCSGKTISGAEMGDDLWLIFASSAISLLAFIIFKSQKTLSKARSIVTVSSLIGLGYLLYKYAKLQSGEFHDAFEIKWGSIATLIGFFISLVGVSFLKDENTINFIARGNSDIGIYCANCGKKYSSESAGKFCEECGNKL